MEQSERIKETHISVAYATNGVVHHVANLCEAFCHNEKVKEFVLIITGDMSEEYRRLGNDNSIDRQRIKIIDVRNDRTTAESVISSFDLVIGTYVVDEYLRKRIETGKPTYIFSERIFKKYYKSRMKNAVINLLRYIKYKKILNEGGYFKDNVYFLTAGKYAADDYKLLGVKDNRIIRFGYFPKGVIERRNRIETKESIVHLIWAGRLVKWKHPEYSIMTYKYLTKKGYEVDLSIVGNGEQEEHLKTMINSGDKIHMLGGMPTSEVRKIMQKSDIFLFTSNEGEGWGVVLNEAMSEGCIPVASYSAGSTTELVEDGVNGFVYYKDNIEELFKKTEMLVKDYDKVLQMRQKCYETIENEWNADSAVSRLLDSFFKIDFIDLKTATKS